MSFLSEQLATMSIIQNRWTWQSVRSQWPNNITILGEWTNVEKAPPTIKIPKEDYTYVVDLESSGGGISSSNEFFEWGPVPLRSPVPNHAISVGNPNDDLGLTSNSDSVKIKWKQIGNTSYYSISFEILLLKTSFGKYSGIGAFTTAYNRNILSTSRFEEWQINDGPKRSASASSASEETGAEGRSPLYLSAELRENSPVNGTSDDFSFVLDIILNEGENQMLLFEHQITEVTDAIDFKNKLEAPLLDGDFGPGFVQNILAATDIPERDVSLDSYL
tara:strand:+ start:93333 stop:94160 length:828 start_codon:yes stop_codon:yes gene_type:complete